MTFLVIDGTMHWLSTSNLFKKSQISQSKHKFVSEDLRRNKQKRSAGKETIEEKQTILKNATS